MFTDETIMEKSTRFFPLLPSIVTILILAGGIVGSWATHAATLQNHEARIQKIEATYVSKEVADVRAEDTNRRLTNIEDNVKEIRDYIINHKQVR